MGRALVTFFFCLTAGSRDCLESKRSQWCVLVGKSLGVHERHWVVAVTCSSHLWPLEHLSSFLNFVQIVELSFVWFCQDVNTWMGVLPQEKRGQEGRRCIYSYICI